MLCIERRGCTRMGLDISAHSKIKKVEQELTEDELFDGDYIMIYNHPDFADRASTLEDGSVYEGTSEYYSFRAGSYSGYGDWREKLAKLAGYPLTEQESMSLHSRSFSESAWTATSGPFWELIYFSDCEGILDSKTCLKLLEDFKEYERYALLEDLSFYNKYQEWMEALEIGANDGLVRFF